MPVAAVGGSGVGVNSLRAGETSSAAVSLPLVYEILVAVSGVCARRTTQMLPLRLRRVAVAAGVDVAVAASVALAMRPQSINLPTAAKSCCRGGGRHAGGNRRRRGRCGAGWRCLSSRRHYFPVQRCARRQRLIAGVAGSAPAVVAAACWNSL